METMRGDRPGPRREQDSKGNDHAEAEVDRESHSIESDVGAPHHQRGASTAPRASVSVAG